jgi:hypothetical protein
VQHRINRFDPLWPQPLLALLVVNLKRSALLLRGNRVSSVGQTGWRGVRELHHRPMWRCPALQLVGRQVSSQGLMERPPWRRRCQISGTEGSSGAPSSVEASIEQNRAVTETRPVSLAAKSPAEDGLIEPGRLAYVVHGYGQIRASGAGDGCFDSGVSGLARRDGPAHGYLRARISLWR